MFIPTPPYKAVVMSPYEEYIEFESFQHL